MRTWTKRISLTLWPVGQGLFANLDTWVGGKSHRTVYDCGSFSIDHQITEQAFSSMAGHPVDLLVVSHFHWDHISRIPHLFRAVGSAKDVWIPYVSPKERILYAIATAVGGLLSGAHFTDVVDIARIAGGAREWFEAQGCSVHEIGGTPPDVEDTRPPDDTQPDQPEEWEAADDRGGGDELGSPSTLLLGPVTPAQDLVTSGSAVTATQSSLEASDRGARKQAVVQFLTWNRPASAEQTDRLLRTIERWLKRNGAGSSGAELCKSSPNHLDARSLDAVTKGLSARSSRRELRQIYLSLNSDLNASSLFLLVRPTQRGCTYRFRHERKIGRYFGRETDVHQAPGVLFTGDAPDTVLNEVLSDATEELHAGLREVLLHLVPHHGSRGSLSKDWFTEVGQSFNPAYCPTSVVSCGRSNDYGHPSPRVLWELSSEVVSEASRVFEASYEWR